MADRVRNLDAAVALVPDGALLGVGGALLKRKPLAFVAALATEGRRGLRLVSFLASVKEKLLAAAGAWRSCTAAT